MGKQFETKERFSLDVRENFFTWMMLRQCNRLPREAVDASSMEAFKARLDEALDSLIWWLAKLTMVGGLKLNDLYSHFQPRTLYDFFLNW